MRPSFRVLANGSDITSDLSNRLVSLTVTDEAGEESDKVDIELDDRGGEIAIPSAGATLSVALGLNGALFNMGDFVVDEVGGGLFPATMRISGKPANMQGSIRTRQNRHWKKKTLAEIVTTIAGEHGLSARVSDALAGVPFEYLAQTSESDLNLLTRLARDLDAVFKPAGQSLVFVPRGESKAGDGSALPVITIDRADMAEGGNWRFGARQRNGKVTAEWNDLASGTIKKVTAGEGDQELRLRHTYATEGEARSAANGTLNRSKRSGKITVNLAGFWPQLMAEAQVRLTGLRPGLNGTWLVKSVTHMLDGALTTNFSAEQDPEGGSSND